MAKRLDDVMSRLGTGRWNLLHIISLSYCFSLTTYHTLGGAFLAPRVDYTCRRPEDAHDGAAARAASPLSVPADGNTSREARPECSYFVLNSFSGQVEEEPCFEWDFDNSTFSSTVGSEFQLACGWEYLRSTYQSIYMFGVTIGAPFNGVLADRYGRKMTVGVGFVAYSALAIGSCWIPNLSALLLSRFFMGAVHPTIQKTGYILGMEVADPKWRTHIGIVLFLPWALGLMAWGGFAYLVRDWRMLQMTVSLQCLAFLPTLWFMDESPRWLAVRGQHRRALRVLQRAARWNGVALPPEDELLLLLKDGVKDEAMERPYQEAHAHGSKGWLRRRFDEVFILFRTPRLRAITLSLYSNYLLVGAVYFGLSLSGGDLSSDPFLYMALTGVVELPAYTLVIPLVARYGRRAPVVAFFFMGAVALLALPFVPTGSGESMTLALMGKMSIASAFQILDFYSSELFPTEVRTRGMSTSLVMSRVGSTCSPFITDYLGPLYPWAPSAVFGAASVLAGLATLPLPETLHVPLPDTIAHLEEREIRTSGFLRLPVRDPRIPSIYISHVD
ncbi:organic cation transporter protein-like [Penaeus monodon]|uniref:organic cation transporter protein-like n=1 Tax=Penaeus monodon TaxID=6687 RepID=UPI0018A6FFC4|nr:organic cation transporter protein-like [Penaeus monodon]XP_037786211.1 organic cation transporter protein-like [Penaeus monodon]XP_037786212.1 organic cation transporter protein-like [Penaeus monodon]XP_037786213.1 organic cation transporter protein-like [Penaeus monodon]